MTVIDRLEQYLGGKNASGVFQWLIGLMPTHAVYVEAFVGSGALLRRKVPAMASIAIDVDPDVAAYWRRRKFPGTTIFEGVAVLWLEEHADVLGSDCLAYLDPPYRLDVRTKNRLYSEEMTAAKHQRLLAVCRRLGCHVILSGYSTPEYELTLGDWHREERWVVTRGGHVAERSDLVQFQPENQHRQRRMGWPLPWPQLP